MAKTINAGRSDGDIKSSVQDKTEDNAYEKTSKFVTTFITPLNALYVFPVVLAALLDFLSPFGKYLLLISGLSILLLVMASFAYIRKIPVWISKGIIAYIVVACLVFCSSAIANLNYADNGGFLANHVPNVKTWQDQYLLNIKKDTEAILDKTNRIEDKVDKNSVMLAQLLATAREPLEKVLKEEIPSYDRLAQNQKDSLVYFTSKVGSNGIKKYQKLLKSVEQYQNSPTAKNEKSVLESFNIIVEVNGKRIEDSKTRLFALAMFFEPKTFEYLMGNAIAAPVDSPILKLFGINPELPAKDQIKDPLGDFIAQLVERKTKINETIVIPKNQKEQKNSKKPSHGNAIFFGIN